MSEASQVFLRIPKILSAFGSQLEPPDFLSSILVCRLWYDAMIPKLWYSVDDSKYSVPGILLLHDSNVAKGDRHLCQARPPHRPPHYLDQSRHHGRLSPAPNFFH